MRPTLLKQTIKSLFGVTRTLCIEGAPGGGKTTIVHEAARELGVPCIELHLPTMLVEDFGILFPDKEGDTLHYKLPYWFPVKNKAPDRGILLFDDRNQAGPELQKVLANICQARTLHGHSLPDGWMVVSTGNRQQDRAGANRVLSHLRNRETVLELETHLDDWTSWAVAHNVKPEVISFIRYRPTLLHDFDPQRDANPTPRSWVEGVGNLLGVIPQGAEFECFKGAVGEGAAAEFLGFLRVYRSLPDIDDILKNPTTAPVPTDPATLYALSGALAHRATENNFSSVVEYTSRIPAEFSVLAVSQAVRRDPALTNNQAFTRWAVQNQNMLF